MDNLEKVIKVALETRVSLIKQWEQNVKEGKSGFYDKSVFTNCAEGVLPDAIGLTSLLLLFVAFKNEKKMIDGQLVVDEATKKQVTEIINKTMPVINERINKYGFNADPVKSSADITRITRNQRYFSKEVGYTDTVTWVLSLGVFTRYVYRSCALNITSDNINIVNNLIAQALSLIVKGQKDDGSWGHRTDLSAKSSLYYSYAVVVSLCDFYYYIFGEIEKVEEVDGGADTALNEDTEVIGIVAAELGCSAGALKEKLDGVRNKFSLWLIKNCLPYLPFIAECNDNVAGVQFSEADYSRMGIEKISEDKYVDGMNYYNLYYTYYVIDAMISNEADVYYDKLCDGEIEGVSFDDLKAYYKDLKFADGKTNVFSDKTYRYFFENDSAAAPKLWKEYIKQALFASRVKYYSANRTGQSWWDNSESELTLIWQTEGEKALKFNDITDPALMPMAVRANLQYCYYITQQSDVTMDELFDSIIENRSIVDDQYRVLNLWDNLNYNLMVTERSVEAIVDYYDYLRKVQYNQSAAKAETSGKKTETVKGVNAKSEIDIAVENKIKEYLASPEGESLIAAKVKEIAGEKASAETSTAVTGQTLETVIEWIANACEGKGLQATDDVSSKTINYLPDILVTIVKQYIYTRYGDSGNIESLINNFSILFQNVVNDAGNSDYLPTMLYLALKKKSDGDDGKN